MTKNSVYVQDNGFVLVRPKNESTLVLTTKQVCDACKKQIPKKPTKETMDNGVDISGESDIEHDFCYPVCCNVVGMFDGNENLPFADYCDNCGQALDWSDTLRHTKN